ncbi:dTDP-4-dehydrorhamnose 3,5-epimerase [Sphingomonas ginsenosidivorax]|uniref:dTDP-4-dehydrorhamnose 3,5-epimerase n=1 Tax=Sphingomonas ginsenosidivorax TaxID=862135 RepID=A0A5C6UHZ4_9SPHN|nr:dTDP-4-dehydrorhamnose 3,5-epimerase [Sphingomonas ginsenosidivorax]TXC72014.1 dTDP-4-dehydrorhamnose 3,5-epimerase [Sphingomonas ginsenosidivorax]
MDTTPTDIPGCYVLQPKVVGDLRGSFVKTFHDERFAELGLRTDWREEYFSVSARGVVRGMHFQTPPAAHAKMVFCLTGEVLDVVLDLRRGSPAFGRPLGFTLSAQNSRGLYLPSGCAHGFLSISEASGMYYKVTSVHSPAHDAGIAWNSIGFDWPIKMPALSERDGRHHSLADFDTPFTFDPAQAAR